RTAIPTGDPSNGALCSQPEIEASAQYCGNCDVEHPAEPCSSREERNCGPVAVGSHSPNPRGLFGTIGNVAELVWDLYDENGLAGANPTGPVDMGQDAITRGGGYCGSLAQIRSASRTRMGRDERLVDAGFRLVRTIGPPDLSLCDNGC